MQRWDLTTALRSMLATWCLSVASMLAVLILSLYISYRWLPLAALVIDLPLFVRVRANRNAGLPSCQLVGALTQRIILWSAIFYEILNIVIPSSWYDPIVYETGSPYVATVVLAPVGLVITSWALCRRFRVAFCTDCRMRNGSSAERGFLGLMFSQEGWFQVRFMRAILAVLTACVYFYYIVFYVKTTRFTDADMFMFFWLPSIFAAVSVVYMAVRYFNIWAYYENVFDSPAAERTESRSVRFLVFCNDRLLLERESDGYGYNREGKMYDTPAQLSVFHTEMTLDDARKYFNELSGAGNFRIRFMYRSLSAGGEHAVRHYLVMLDGDSPADGFKFAGDWHDLNSVDALLNADELMPMLSAEIYRLFTITMAWKTYTVTGHRRYAIKGYRPTFHISDIFNDDIDFNDPRWLCVSFQNQDRRFWRFRRFWRRYVNGIKEQ